MTNADREGVSGRDPLARAASGGQPRPRHGRGGGGTNRRRAGTIGHHTLSAIHRAETREGRGAMPRAGRALAFNMDKAPQDVWNLPTALAYAGAPFPAVHLEQWPSGALVAAMRPVGVRVADCLWAPPIVAVRDGPTVCCCRPKGSTSSRADPTTWWRHVSADDAPSSRAQRGTLPAVPEQSLGSRDGGEGPSLRSG